ncbi:arginase family protein [Microbacterium capsulatum]|uniref:Arginase family protein n=1 Tax=Microbacterium capsulatum TaxID=3041921 RepID=A0ABU0XC95_9MICO|nr:arginase family protein [Microbacterium sp. ASV81]MDQ4212698.1 arginase family protein [Microbacterium sp. ASV81]
MIAVVSAPTNLGLRPPVRGGVPGAGKAPEALREAGLHRLLQSRGALDGGVVLPGRYVDDDGRRPAGRVRNEAAIVDHARRLAHRLVEIRRAGDVPLVLGGDCSLAIGAGLATRVSGGGGLVHLDGHTDFRHPGNSAGIGSVAGEDLAAAIGLHSPAMSDIDGLSPYFAPERTAHIGCRYADPHVEELRALIPIVVPADDVILHGGARAAARVRATEGLESGYWIQVDVDVLDPVHMPAVDSPDPGGLAPDELVGLLAALAPHAWGAAVTVFDPDLDPEGVHARTVAAIVAEGLADLGAARTED